MHGTCIKIKYETKSSGNLYVLATFEALSGVAKIEFLQGVPPYRWKMVPDVVS